MIRTDIITVYLIMRRVKGSSIYIPTLRIYTRARPCVVHSIQAHSNASIMKCKEYRYSTVEYIGRSRSPLHHFDTKRYKYSTLKYIYPVYTFSPTAISLPRARAHASGPSIINGDSYIFPNWQLQLQRVRRQRPRRRHFSPFTVNGE